MKSNIVGLLVLMVLLGNSLFGQLQPVNLPLYENFESANGTFTANSNCVYCNSFIQFDFREANGDGYLTFDSKYSNRSIGLNDSVSAGFHAQYSFGPPVNRLIATINLSNYDTADVTSVLLSFWHFDHYDEPHLNDIVMVRGSKVDNWVSVHDLSQNVVKGAWVKVSNLNISQFLKENNQNFSNEFQILFSQQDNSDNFNADGRSFDDIIIEEVSCVPPGNLSITGITDTSASISWTNAPNQQITELWLREANAFAGSKGSKQITSTGNSFNVDTLKPYHDYEVLARHICAVGDTSAWTEVISFKTICSVVQAPYFENFNLPTGRFGDFENCWFGYEKINRLTPGDTYRFVSSKGYGPSTSQGPITDAGYGYGGYICAFPASVNYNDTAFIEFNSSVDISALSSPELRFSYHILGQAFPHTLVLEIDSGSGWNPELSISGMQQSSSSSPWRDTAVSLSGYSGTVKFRFYSHQTYQVGHVAIDEVEVGNGITCLTPRPLSLSTVSNSSATLAFTSNVNSTDTFQLSYSNSLQQPAQGNKLIFSGSIANITGLNAASRYCVYVRQICGVGDTSLWSPVACFNTACPPQSAPYFQNFDNYPGPTMPPCWIANGQRKDTTVAVVDSTDRGGIIPSAPHALELNEGSPSIAVGPRFLDLSTGVYQIRFKMAYEDVLPSYLIDTLYIGTVSDPNDASTFKKYQRIIHPGVDIQFHEYIVKLTDTSLIGGNERIAFKHAQNAGFEYYIDDFHYERISPCARVTNAFISDSTCTSIELTWNSASGQSFIEYGAKGFSLGQGSYTGVANSPYRVNGLGIGAYDFYIYDVCQGDTSVFFGPISGNTGVAVEPIASFSIVSDSARNGIKYLTLDASSSIDGYYYYWNFGNGVFVSTNQSPIASTTYSHNGMVTIKCAIESLCNTSDTVSLDYNIYIGTEEWSAFENNVLIFPNPNQGVISLYNDEGVTNVKVYSLEGKTLIETSQTENIELPASSGLYMIAIYFEDGRRVVTKVVRE